MHSKVYGNNNNNVKMVVTSLPKTNGPFGSLESTKQSTIFLCQQWILCRNHLMTQPVTNTKENDIYRKERECLQQANNILPSVIATALAISYKTIQKYNANSSDQSFVGMKILPNVLYELADKIDNMMTGYTTGFKNRPNTNQNIFRKNRKECKQKERNSYLSNSGHKYIISLVRIIAMLCYECSSNQNLLRTTLIPTSTISIFEAKTSRVYNSTYNSVVNNSQIAPVPVTPPGIQSIPQVDRNGIHILLSCTAKTHHYFPLREWCIFAIRNVLENNEENQKVIGKLKVLKGIDSLDLQKMGLEVNVKVGNSDEENRRHHRFPLETVKIRQRNVKTLTL